MFKIKDAWQIVEEHSTEGTWTDVRDGQVYPYKQFGDQIWMTVNFNYGGKQGDWVPNTTAQSNGHAWRYKNVQDYEDWNSSGIDRGAFYTQDSLTSWVIPEGWHIPTKSEWDTLVNWAISEYGDTSKARPALMVKTTKWRSAQTLYSWDDFGLAGFNMIPGGYMGSGTSGTWGDSSLAWNTCIYWVPNSSIETESRVEKTLFNSNTSILFRDQDSATESGRAYAIRLIKDSGVYVPQPAITTITTSLDSTGSDNKIATEKATRTAITNATSSKMSNPMTTAGDVIVGGSSGTPSRLAIGTSGQVLTSNGTTAAWGDIPTQDGDHKVSTDGTDAADYLENKVEAGTNVSITKSSGKLVISSTDTGMINPMTTVGDMIVGGSSGAPSRLGVGSPGQVLKVGIQGITWDDEAVVSISDTDSIGLTIDQNGDLTADLKIDSSSGNVSLTAGSDGLYGNVEFPVAALDSGSPGIIVSGNVDNEYNVGIALSSEPDNILQLKDTGNEGLYAPPSELDGLITTAGDLIVGDASGAPAKLSVGTTGQVLTSNGTTAAWASIPTQTGDHKVSTDGTDAAGYLEDKIDAGTNVSITKSSGKIVISSTDTGMLNPMTTQGDIITGGASGAAGRLGIGTTGQVLTVGSSGPSWEDIPTQTGDHKVLTDGTDTAGYLEDKVDAGTNISITKSSGKIVISSTASGMTNPMTTAGDIITGGASGAAGRLGIGTSGQVLTVGSSGPEWASIPAQTGDHKVSTDGTDAADYLENKVEAGTNVSITKSSGKIVISSTSSGGMINPMTTAGDIIVGGSSGTPDRLGKASSDGLSVLASSNLTSTGWQRIDQDILGFDPSTDNHTMFYMDKTVVQTRAGEPEQLTYKGEFKKITAGTTGQVLKLNSSGVPTWGNGLDNIITTSGDLVVGDSNGTPSRMAHGDAGNVLVSSSGGVLWSDIAIPLGADKNSPGEIFYTMNEDEQTRAGGITNYDIKLKRLPAGTTGNILSLEESTYNGGLSTQYIPHWRTEADVFQSGHPMTAFGDIIYAGSTDLQGRRTALSLPAGTLGQVLGLEAIPTFGMKPKWIDLPGTCQENFNICLSTKKENLTSNPNKLYAAKFISHETAKRTKFGFYHCIGIQGIVMMGVYDNLGNLIGQTGPCSFATEPDEEMIWYDAETPFTVTAGEEYWFVFWGGTAQGEYNMSLTVLQHEITQNFDPYIVGSCSYTSSKTTLPSTIPSLQYETTLCYMAIK